jgi:hypothetical protein
MSRKLPYPGHSWSFTQHAVALDPVTLYDFLKCAAPFEGQSEENYRTGITNLMVELKILTPNVRGQVPDAWRDYQQVLAELGLIYSTTLSPSLRLTDIGHLYLAGEIGFSELIGMQALRYQYPNGQKSTIQARLRTELSSQNQTVPSTLIELQANKGVLVKPGVLVLRILIELMKLTEKAIITVDECQKFLLPCTKNSEWPLAIQEIIAFRKNTTRDLQHENQHSRRNFQDWFKFLSKSDFFDRVDASQITLSDYAIENMHWVGLCCDKQEDLSSFWIPTNFDILERKDWFSWFGSLDDESQLILRTDVTNDKKYSSINYVGSPNNTDFDLPNAGVSSEVNLQDLDLDSLERDPNFNFSGDMSLLVENLRKGAEKRHAKTVLHDKIIKQLADRFILQGAKVKSDPNTIDLYAQWPSGDSAIFEVKTVTRKSFQNRLRSAIGQIQEYTYRKNFQGPEKSDRIIVVNTIISDSAWQADFLTDYLKIGLICETKGSYKAFSPVSSCTRQYWQNNK